MNSFYVHPFFYALKTKIEIVFSIKKHPEKQLNTPINREAKIHLDIAIVAYMLLK